MLGNVGTGKTILLNFAAYACDVAVISCPIIAAAFARGGENAFWQVVENRSMTGADLMLDDLGAEDASKRFGNTLPMIDLLYRRYDIWRAIGGRVWLTSNLTGAQLMEKYGERVVDRIREMCEIVPATGGSLRK